MNGAVLLLGAPCTQPERWARRWGVAHASTTSDVLRWWQQARVQRLTRDCVEASAAFNVGRVLLLAPDPGLPLSPNDEAADSVLRAVVQSLGLPLQVLYPSGTQGWAPALRQALVSAIPQHTAPSNTPTWHRMGCEDCSDPACERRLFQDLLAQRGAR